MYDLKTKLEKVQVFSHILHINSKLVKYKPGIVLFVPEVLKFQFEKITT